MGHNHNHNHHDHKVSGKNIGIAVFLNIIITVGQLIGGIISGSVALLTDALHNFSDVISLLLSYFTNRLAKRKSTEHEQPAHRAICEQNRLSALPNSRHGQQS